MQVNIIEEAGYNAALYGFSLSYKDRAIPREEWWGDCFDCMCKRNQSTMCDGVIGDSGCKQWSGDKERKQLQTQKTATANAGRGMGHDKWLRQVQVWLDVEMCRAWWPEMDQYKVATVTSSESTVHTLMKRPITLGDCEVGTAQVTVDAYNSGYPYNNLHTAKMNLPEGYLQRRVLSCNYATLRNIISQRKGHRMPEWSYFIDAIYAQAQHPELLPSRGE